MSRYRPLANEPDKPGSGRWGATSLLLLGLILGLVVGLSYAWLIDPVIFVEASPARLNQAAKTDYILLVGQSYAANGHWPQAQQRLAALNDPALEQTVAELLDAALRNQQPPQTVQALAQLAQALGVENPAIALFAPTALLGEASLPTATFAPPSTATLLPTPTPQATPTAVPTMPTTPTQRPSPTPPPVYRLLNQERVCTGGGSAPHIEVVTLDALLNELPGVEVWVRWEEGSDRFFTGFKPEQGASYGDFTMSADTSYTILLPDGSPEVSGLHMEPCANGQDGGWRLTFQNLLLEPTETPEP